MTIATLFISSISSLVSNAVVIPYRYIFHADQILPFIRSTVVDKLSLATLAAAATATATLGSGRAAGAATTLTAASASGRHGDWGDNGNGDSSLQSS